MVLKELDFLSPKLTLYFNGQKSHSSKIGGLLTIISYSLVLIFGLYISRDLILRKNPYSYSYFKVIDDVGEFKLDSSNIFHYLKIKKIYNNIDFLKYFQVIGLNSYLSENRENYDHWIYEKCTENMNNLNKYKKIKNILDINDYTTNSFCISKFYNSTSQNITLYNDTKNFQYPYIKHGMSNSNGTYYIIYFQKCINSTINNYSCVSEEEIDEYLETYGGILGFNFLNNYIDINNYKNPINNNLYKIGDEFGNEETYVTNNINLIPLYLITNDMYIFDNKKYIKTYKYEQNQKVTYDRENGILGMFSLWMQNNAEVNMRNYKKLADILASIGGIMKCIIVISNGINYIYMKFITYYDINKIMNICVNYKDNNKKNFNILNLFFLY